LEFKSILELNIFSRVKLEDGFDEIDHTRRQFNHLKSKIFYVRRRDK